MSTYSFLDCQATINGPGGSFSLGAGAGAAEEGISVNQAEEKDTLTVGADGSAMHSLHAGTNGTVTVRLLKTSPRNQQLMALYNSQKQTSANWGQNNITVSDIVRGDVISARSVAFAKVPDLTFAKDAGVNEWTFTAGHIEYLLGAGVPDTNI